MKNTITSPRFLVITLLILVGITTRFISAEFQLWNFTAIGATALFAGAMFTDKRFAFIVPILALMLSDLFIPGGFNYVVYACFALVVFIGILIRNNPSVKNIVLGALSSSLIFYLITNLPIFYSMYPNTFGGAIASYTAALPFFRNMVAGDLIYSGVLFGSFYFLTQRFPVLATK